MGILKAIKKQKDQILLIGSNVYCNICDKRFRKFKSFGNPVRENSRCPNCYSLERHRLLNYYFIENNFSDFLTNKSILHVAPEKFFYDQFKNLTKEYQPVDLLPEEYPFTDGPSVKKEDLTQLSFADDSFDFIMCNHVLEHIPQDAMAMSELYRVLKKGGRAILQVPLDYSRDKTYEDDSIVSHEDRHKEFGRYDHVRMYGKDYANRLSNAGFQVQELKIRDELGAEKCYEYGLMLEDNIFLCTKN